MSDLPASLANVDWRGLLSTVGDIAFWLVALVIILAITLYLMFVANFKHKVRIKEITNGRKIIFDDRAREVEVDGVKFWNLLKKKDIIPVPPPEAIEINHMGKKCVEVYKTEYGDYRFAKDTAKIEEPPKEILEIKDTVKREEGLKKWQEENKIIDTFHPLTTKQRVILISQIRKAQEKKTKKWQDMILPIAGIAALVVIVVALMIFYEDMGKPLLAMADRQTTYEAQKTEQLQILKEIKLGIQIIREEQGAAEAKPPD